MEDFEAFLLEKKVVRPAQLEQASNSGFETTEPLYYRLLRKFPDLEEPLWRALAEFLGLELVDPHQIQLKPELIQIVPARLAHKYAIVPIDQTGTRLDIALADPNQFEKCEEFSLLFSQQATDKNPAQTSLKVTPHLAMPGDVAMLIKSLYGIGADTVQDMLDHHTEGKSDMPVLAMIGPEVVDLTNIEGTNEDAAIIRFVNQLLLEAVKIGASDIHLEPFEKELSVRYRVDGMLQREPVPERIKNLEPAIISRIKIMARMDIAEKRLPQDGQIRLMVMGRTIDVRVSILPTMFGQGLALRLLDRQITFRRLDNLGIPSDYLRLFREVLKLSHGVILVTGPTGSGKTTTLYSCLNEICTEDRKIITVEDPIEYQLEGISQIQVKPDIGLNFANVLRNILRHDPDIIMVGEIRDTATAQLAISAAMTGHLVFSTLHTNNAPSAPVRLLEMGVEPYLVSSTLEAVVAQRLVRRLCRHCRQDVTSRDALPEEYRDQVEEQTIYESRGCPLCRQTGYQGRTAIFEMFTLNDHIRNLILKRADSSKINEEAMRLGMRSLRQSGLDKVISGETSLVEIYRVTREETIDMRGVLQEDYR